MKFLKPTLFLIYLLQLTCSAQVQLRKFESGDIFEIPELGAIIIEEDNKLIVDILLPADNRPKDYKNVDLQKGDEIKMVNGKKASSIKDCQKIYDKLKIGSEFKMGINRNGTIFIVGFNKADPKTLPVRKRIVITDDDNPGEIRLPALGLFLKEKNNKLIVDEVLEHASSVLKKDIKKGDILIKLNSKEIKSAQQFSKQFDEIKVGDDLSIDFSRNGKTIPVNIKRPKPMGRVVIKN